MQVVIFDRQISTELVPIKTNQRDPVTTHSAAPALTFHPITPNKLRARAAYHTTVTRTLSLESKKRLIDSRYLTEAWIAVSRQWLLAIVNQEVRAVVVRLVRRVDG